MFGWWHKKPVEKNLRQDVLDLIGMAPLNLETLKIDGHKALVVLNVAPEDAADIEPIRSYIETHLRRQPRIKDVQVILTAERPMGTAPAKIPANQPAAPVAKPMPPELAVGVKWIVAVASGKGGVGKSTVAANLAVAFAQMGLVTGLLDADIYGPSVPLMMGRAGIKPEHGTNNKLVPVPAHGLRTMSIGFLVDTDAPMIWRGPMVQSAIIQMLRDVDWAGTDILVVDMPPGTGDAQLTFAQKIPLSGAVIVSTPQDVALIDARKGLEMFRKVGVPLLGLVENMAYFCCPNCGHQTDIFGHGGARRDAEKMNVPFLGEIPLGVKIREYADTGTPIIAAEPQSEYAVVYRNIAQQVIDQLSLKDGVDHRSAPTIRIID